MPCQQLCAVILSLLCAVGVVRAAAQPKPVAEIRPDKTVPLALTDPTPHSAEAEAGRFLDEPRYDLPPRGFNEHSFFKDALVNFDAISGWTAEMRDCEGIFCLSEDMPIRQKRNAKIEVTLTGEKPCIALKPPQPIRIPHRFDTVDLWFYGHKVGPKVGYLFRKADGTLYRWMGGTVKTTPPGWTNFWNRLRIRLPVVIEANAELVAVEIYPVRWSRTDLSLAAPKEEDYLYYVDQLRVSLFEDMLKEPAPQFPNKGPIVQIPVDERGACPRTTEPVTARVRIEDGVGLLTYTTASGEEVTYAYAPKTGSLTDLTVQPKGKAPFRPAVDSGPFFDFGGQACGVVGTGGAAARLLSHNIEGDALIAEWEYSGNNLSQVIRYEFSLKGKTLQIQLSSTDTHFSEWKFGYADGLKDYRAIDVPFMTASSPRLLLHDGLFVTYCADWYKSNVSTVPDSRPQRPLPEGAAQYSFNDPEYDTRPYRYAYLARTDGSRHPLKECFYITVSSNVDDVWLSIANPPSPMKDVIKDHLYRMTSPTTGEFLANTHRQLELYEKYGVTKFYWLYHVRLWMKRRMGCDPFFGADAVSLVHEPSGGDAALIALFQRMRDMGIRPGYYDGYESMMTPHRWFRADWCKVDPDGNWHVRWGAVMKPWALSEYAATVYRDRAKKFGARVVYQDGWTSSNPCAWNDYDPRYPESGTFIDTLRALGTGWQRCRENVGGPVFSEGRGGDYYTAGLNDGDYGKSAGFANDKPCTEDRTQLLVDFRLKKVGPLSAPVSIDICYKAFAADERMAFEDWYAREDSYAYLHHFLATQIAFATIGMLEPYWVSPRDPTSMFDKTMTCYFMIQQLQKRYLLEPVQDVLYWDGTRLLNTSEALRTDVVKDNRLRIRYRNGLVIHANVNWDGKHWVVQDRGQDYDLPPGGWLARQGDEFFEFAAMRDGRRLDFVDSPDYIYVDGHGAPVTVNGYHATNQYIRFKSGPKAGLEVVYPEK